LEIRQTGSPCWSADGRELAFAWSRGAETDLWAVSSEAREPGRPGGRTVRQVSSLADRSGAAISPDWDYVAYVFKDHIWQDSRVCLLHGRRTWV
jgi:Tol biopolymer transport system component